MKKFKKENSVEEIAQKLNNPMQLVIVENSECKFASEDFEDMFGIYSKKHMSKLESWCKSEETGKYFITCSFER